MKARQQLEQRYSATTQVLPASLASMYHVFNALGRTICMARVRAYVLIYSVQWLEYTLLLTGYLYL